MHPTASHLVVNINLIAKIGPVVFTSKFKIWCMERITFKGANWT